jgi:hypothetical protein
LHDRELMCSGELGHRLHVFRPGAIVAGEIFALHAWFRTIAGDQFAYLCPEGIPGAVVENDADL